MPLTRTALSATLAVALLAAPATAGPDGATIARGSDCFACHTLASSERKKDGPAYEAVAKRYAGDAKAPAMLADVIRKGGSGHWGAGSMPAHPQFDEPTARALATWVLSLKTRPAKPIKPSPRPARK